MKKLPLVIIFILFIFGGRVFAGDVFNYDIDSDSASSDNSADYDFLDLGEESAYEQAIDNYDLDGSDSDSDDGIVSENFTLPQQNFFSGDTDTFSQVDSSSDGVLPSGSFTTPTDAPAGVQKMTLKEFIQKVLDFALGFLGIIAIAAVIYAGFLYIVDGGDDSNKEKGKKIIIYVAIGIIIILASYALVYTLISMDGSGGDNEEGRVGGSGGGSGGSSTKIEAGFDLADLLSGGDGFYVNSNNQALNDIFNENGWGEYTGNSSGGTFVSSGGGGSISSGMISPTVVTSLSQEIAANPAAYAQPSNSSSIPSFLPPATMIVTGEGVEDYGRDVLVPYETALKGVEIGSSLSAQVVFDFGDGIRQGIDTISNPGENITHAFGERKTYYAKAIVQTVEGQIYSIQKNIVVGGIKSSFGLSDSRVAIEEQITLTSKASSSLGEILHYRWRCEGGDGCFEDKSGKIAYVSFSIPGEYEVFHEVENSLETTAEVYDVITVYGEDPVANFTIYDESTSQNPARFKFDAGDSYGISGQSSGLTYYWDFDGEEEKNSTSVVYHEFDTIGDKTITLKVEERAGSRKYESEEVEKSVNVESILSVDFTAPTLIQKNQVVTFTGTSSLAEEFVWNFGDGSEEVYGKVSQHSFSESGNFDIKLKVSNSDEETEITKKITVLNSDRPTAILKVIVNGKEVAGNIVEIVRGDDVSFSSDSRDAEEGTNLNITWFVDGKNVTTPQIPSFFQNLGTYQIKLVVSDPDNSNLKDEAIFSVQVKNNPPKINSITWTEDPDYGAMQLKVSVNAEDKDGGVKDYRFEVLEYGSSVAVQLTDQPEAIFNLNQYPGKHSYFFRVTATDSEGGVTRKTTNKSYRMESIFENTAPEVSIFPQPGNFGTTETNFLLLSNVNDAENDSLTYEWTFPDNKKIYTKDANFQFSEAGTYKVTLSVSDGLETTEASIDINVEEAAYSPQGNNAPTVEIAKICPGLGGDTETIFSFYAEASDYDKDALTYEWIFPDGQKVFLKNVRFKFSKVGTYSVKIRVSDGLVTVEDSVQITVGELGTEVSETFEGCPADEELVEEEETTTSSDPKSEEKPSNAVFIETTVDCEKVLKSYRVAQVEKLNKTEDQYQRDKIIDNLYEIGEEIKKCPNHPTEVPKEIRANLAIESDYITIRGGLNTTFFLYGKVVNETDSAFLFEWNSGDGRIALGQKVSFKYSETGLYKVRLKITDGLTELSDYINILVE